VKRGGNQQQRSVIQKMSTITTARAASASCFQIFMPVAYLYLVQWRGQIPKRQVRSVLGTIAFRHEVHQWNSAEYLTLRYRAFRVFSGEKKVVMG
jgi:hypothetical protein